MGFFSNLWEGAKNLASNVWNKVKSTASELYNRGSTILTASHYLGPYNSLDPEYRRTHPPVDRADAAALEHDLTYVDIARRTKDRHITVPEANRLTRESDNKFLDSMKQEWTTSPYKSTLGYLGVKGKTILEDMGILNPNTFVRLKHGGAVGNPYGASNRNKICCSINGTLR